MNYIEAQPWFFKNKTLGFMLLGLSFLTINSRNAFWDETISLILIISAVFTISIDKKVVVGKAEASDINWWRLFASVCIIVFRLWIYDAVIFYMIRNEYKEEAFIYAFLMYFSIFLVTFYITFIIKKHNAHEKKTTGVGYPAIAAFAFALALLLPRYYLRFIDVYELMSYERLMISYCIFLLPTTPLMLFMPRVRRKTGEPRLLCLDRKIGENFYVPVMMIIFYLSIIGILLLYLMKREQTNGNLIFFLAVGGSILNLVLQFIYQSKRAIDREKFALAFISVYSLFPAILFSAYYLHNGRNLLGFFYTFIIGWFLSMLFAISFCKMRRYEEKIGYTLTCAKCGGAVAHSNGKCPHCGVGFYGTSGHKPDQSRYHYTKRYCQTCGKRVDNASKVHDKCKKCGVEWEGEDKPTLIAKI